MSDSPFEAALGAMLRLLERRRRSVVEIRRKLHELGYGETIKTDVVARLTAAGLLDDRVYAEAFVKDGVRLKGHGRFRLSGELRQRGIDPDLADEVLDELCPAETDQATALNLAQRRAARLATLEVEVARRRLAAFLERRGFSAHCVWEAVDAVLPRGRER